MGVKSLNGIEPTLRRPIVSDGPHRTLYPRNDNTVGPVTLTSGYGSNTFSYSAAHVLDPSTKPNIIPDTRKCEPNLEITFPTLSYFTQGAM